MMPFTKVLVAVDFSPHSDEATRVAADIALRYGAQLLLLHVYEPVAYALPEGYISYTPDQLEKLFAEFEKRLQGAKQIAETIGAVRVDTRQTEGAIANTVVELAGQEGFDLIVVGTHGRRGFERMIMGSVAEKILRQAPCPVLCVRAAQPKNE
jgi:nucleotide-binding universal stress UspA family protein